VKTTAKLYHIESCQKQIIYAKIKYFKKYHSFGTISKSYNKIVERGKIDTYRKLRNYLYVESIFKNK
jgi:hypothetical protein